MKNDDLYGRNGSNSSTPNSRLRGKSSISSDQTESFRMIDIDVKKAKKDIDDIFSYTKDRLKDNSKEFVSSTDEIFKRASSQSDQFFKSVDAKIDQLFSTVNSQMDKLEKRASDMGMAIAEEVSAGYDLAYDSADSRHKRSVANRLREEQKLAQDVGKMYEESLSGNPTINAMIDSVNKATEEARRKKKEKDNTIYSAKDVLTDSDARGINTEAYMNNLRTGIIGAIIDGGKQFVSIWMNRFESGMRRIVDTYEDTFHNVSVLTDTSQKAYGQMQDDIQDYLRDNNLNNAIRISDVMRGMHDAVMQGITNAGEAQNIALENSITKAINPFINVTTDAYQDMQMSLGSDFVNSANAIVKAVNDGTAGTIRFISKNIDDMLTQFEPVILNAKSEQFDKQFAEMAADLEAAVASGAMTSQQAEEYKQSMYSMTNDPYNTITNSNDISLVRSMLDSLQNGDFENQNIEGMLKTLAENDQRLYEGTQDAFSRSIVQSNIGSNRTSIWQDSDALNEVTKIINDKNSGDYEDALTSLTKGLEDTYTNLWQKDTGAENNMTDIAQLEQWYPDTTKILKQMAGTLTSILVAIAGNYMANRFMDGGGFSGLFSKVKNTGSSGKALFDMFKSDVKSNGFRSTVKEYAKVFGDDVISKFKNIFKGGADDAVKAAASSKGSGILSKLGSIGSKLSGPLAALGFVVDGISGFTKSDDWYGDNSAGNRVKSTLGSLLAGSGPGAGQGGIGSVALNTGSNALKWGTAGAALGSVIPGLGTAIGGGIGAAIGGITGLVGGERIGDFLGEVGDFIGKAPQVQFISKEFGILKDNVLSLSGEFKDIWKNDDLELHEKIGASFGTIKANIEDTFKDTFRNVEEFYEDSFISDMIDGLKSFGNETVNVLEGAKDKLFEFGSTIKDEFNKFTDDPIEYIKEKGKSALDSIKDFGKNAWDTLGDAKDSVVNFFKEMGNASDEYNKKAKDADKKESQSKGSHASGLNYVPYDGYVASLHKGETVFNRTASNIISQFMGLTGTSNSINTNTVGSMIKSLISNDRNINATTTADKVDAENKLAKVSEKLLSNNNTIQQTFDTTNLEKAIYAIGDKIVTAISNQSNNKRNIVDRSNGTVNVRFGNSNEIGDLTLPELPI